MLPYKNRFHGHNSVSYVNKNGHIERTRFATLKVSKNNRRKDSRIAVVISKKVVKSAVKRNRIRRRIYECVHPKINSFNSVFDIVIIVTSPEIFSTSHTELNEILDSMLQKQKIT